MSKYAALALCCGLVTACSASESRGPAEQAPTEQKAAIDKTAPSASDPACPTSQGGQRDDVLKGQCVTAAQCSITTPGGLSACKPGVKAVPPAPVDWECSCADATWQCAKQNAGFSVLLCPTEDGGGL